VRDKIDSIATFQVGQACNVTQSGNTGRIPRLEDGAERSCGAQAPWSDNGRHPLRLPSCGVARREAYVACSAPARRSGRHGSRWADCKSFTRHGYLQSWTNYASHPAIAACGNTPHGIVLAERAYHEPNL